MLRIFSIFSASLPPCAFALSFRIATTAAACAKCTAVASAERPAEGVSFQRQQPRLPPDEIVNLAVSAEVAAGQFGGKYANYATTATFIAFCAFTSRQGSAAYIAHE